jgi:hypothetical protein
LSAQRNEAATTSASPPLVPPTGTNLKKMMPSNGIGAIKHISVPPEFEQRENVVEDGINLIPLYPKKDVADLLKIRFI